VNIVRHIILIPIYVYRYAVSPLIPSRCIYVPTCSAYMLEAVEKHGVMCGMMLGIKRLLRCHPCAKGCYDPVPKHVSCSCIVKK